MIRRIAASHSSVAVHVYGTIGVRSASALAIETVGVNRPSRVSGNCDLNGLGLLLGLIQPSSAWR
ncbi:MAG: hypothetical protein O2924_04325 [Chloroflexi bacterium]|nr:hypothetical protein [Chloroflexota bacterium]